MEHIIFHCQSASTGEVYVLEAAKTAASARLSCSCQAGQNGMFCKHRGFLFSGQLDQLLDATPEKVKEFAELFAGHQCFERFAEIAALEDEASQIKKRLAKAKKALATSLFGG